MMDQELIDNIWQNFNLLNVKTSNETVNDDTDENNYKCKFCSTDLEIIDEKIICQNCGLVVDQQIFSSYNTIFSNPDCEGYPKIKKCFNSLINKMLDWDKYTPEEKAEYKLVTEILKLCENNNLPENVANLASNMSKIYFKEMKLQVGSRRSKVKNGCIGVCIWYASREFKYSITETKLCHILNIDLKYFTRATKQFLEMLNSNSEFKREFNLENIYKNKTEYDFLLEFLNKLQLQVYFDYCSKIMVFCNEKQIMNNNNPSTKAVSIIQFVNQTKGLLIEKNFIADTCGISTVTISKICNKIMKFQNEIKILLENK